MPALGRYYRGVEGCEQIGKLPVKFGLTKVVKLFFIPIMAFPLFFKD
jgi:hypothetical protein